MERSIGSRVPPCWTSRRSYQRLPAPAPTTPWRPAGGRGIRLGRRAVLGSTVWRFAQLRRAAKARWSPLQLLYRIVDTYISSMLSQPLKNVKGVSPSAAARVVPCEGASPPPPKLRRSASYRRRKVDGKGVMLNICVAEVLLRRSSSDVMRSPLHHRKDEPARSASVRA